MATQVSSGLIENNAINDAHIANVALTGVTASSGDSSTSLATTAFVAGEINSLIDAAPGALNTLNELAAALGDDANFSTTVTNSIATKMPLAGGTFTGSVTIGGSGSEDRALIFGLDGRASAFTGQNAAQIFCGQGGSGDFLAGSLYLQSRSATGGREIAFITGTTPTKKLVIQADGNVLVGATTTTNLSDGTGNDGVHLNPSGTVAAARTSNVTAVFNRLSSHGEIVRFNKDGTTVGSISTLNGMLAIGNDNVFLNIDGGSGDYIYPMSSASGGASDGVVTLGFTSRRFKDLHLSNAANIGKEVSFTNSANSSGFEIGLLGGSADATAFIYQRANDSIKFGTNNTERMSIANDGKVGIGTTSAPAGLPLQTKVSSGDNKLRMTTANKDAFILELKDATGDVHLGTNTTAGALVIEDDGDVYVGGKFAVNNAPISGSQVYIKKASAGTNLMRWGEGDGSTQDSYRFRIDQNFDFIANSGSGDTFNLDSSTGNVSIGHGGVPSAKVDIVSTGSATYSGSSAGSNIALKLRNLESGAANRTIGIAMVSESNAEVYLNCVTNSINNGGDFVIANRHIGSRSERHRFTSDGRQIKTNASIVSNHPGHQMNLGYVPHSAAYGSGTTAGTYLHMKMAQRAGGNSSYTGINVMSRYEYKGYAYGGGFLHSGIAFYTYVGTSTPYGPFPVNFGDGNGMSAYYSSDGYVVIVVHIIANNYTGGVLYFQSGITHRLSDNQITSINYSNSTTGVF